GFNVQAPGSWNNINNQGAAGVAINIQGNQLGSATQDLITFNAATTSQITAYQNQAGASTAVLTITGNDVRRINHVVAGTGAQTYYANTTFTGSENISNNTVTNITANTTGSVTFITGNVSIVANGFQNINGNSIVTGFNKTGAGGTVQLFLNNGSSPATVTEQNNNNNFSNITVTGATTIAGWQNTDGGSPTKTISGNTFSNWTGGTSAITGLNVGFSGAATVSGNTISNIS